MTYKRGEHPNSRKNLEKGKFKKGEVSNPRGRPPRELCITDITRDQLGEPCPKDPTKTWAKYLSDKWLDLACENVWAFKELMERLEGKVVFPIATEEPIDVYFTIGKGYATPEETAQLQDRQQLGSPDINFTIGKGYTDVKIGEVPGRSKEIGPSESVQGLSPGEKTDPDIALPLEQRMKRIEERYEQDTNR